MGKISIEIDDAAIKAKLAAMQGAGSDMSGVLGSIGRTLKTRIDMGFRSSASPWGAPWAPLKARDGKPLIDTGRLKNSITWRAGGGPDGPFVDVGTNIKYAPIHQFGATIPVSARTVEIYRTLKKSGDFANGGRMVKKSKANFASTHAVQAHKITIPARPFLPLNSAGDVDLPQPWADAALRSIKAHFKNAIGGGV